MKKNHLGVSEFNVDYSSTEAASRFNWGTVKCVHMYFMYCRKKDCAHPRIAVDNGKHTLNLPCRAENPGG